MEGRHLQDLFHSSFMGMSLPAPRRLLDLACQNLLRDEASAIAALEWLPMELFPPLFMAAFAGKHSRVLKAMVQAWPFPCLPLGALMIHHQPYQDILQAVFEGLDALLAQDSRPRRWKLQVLNLQKRVHKEFWIVWAGSTAHVCSLLEPEAPQPMRKRGKVHSLTARPKLPLAPVEVLVDLCLKEGVPDESLSYLIKKVSERRGLLHLCCKKLEVFAMSKQNTYILDMVQLDSVQELEVKCTWKLSTLTKFAPYLGQMGNLRRFLLSHVFTSSHTTLEQEEQCVRLITSQFLNLPHLQELYLDEVSILSGLLDEILRFLKTPLETLSITNCLIFERGLRHLSQHLNVSQLKGLSFSGLNLANISSESLQFLLERASPTLQDLDLDECGIIDAQFLDILPALSHCSQLTTLSFCENPISMTVLKDLLRHIVRLSKLNWVIYAAPLESFEETGGTINLGRLTQMHALLKHMLQELGRPSMEWLCAYPCPHCGWRTFHDPTPIL